jgi:hypothetical protein
MSKKLKYIISLSLLPQYLSLLFFKNNSGIIEQYYSIGLYPIISKLLNTFFKWSPISLGDLIYIVIIVFAIRWIAMNFKRLKTHPMALGLDVLTTLSVVYFLFHLCWGLNYYRNSLHTTLNLNPTYTTSELNTITNKLMSKTNKLHLSITNDSLLKVNPPYSFDEMTSKSQQGYKLLETKYPFFKHPGQNTKKSLFSTPLTYMGFGGYLNPFTLEAQVNSIIPNTSMLTTITHEQAHQLGYAAENEANFIGFLACIHNKDLYYQYAGYAFALRYCLFELQQRDKEQYDEVLNSINPGILINYQETSDFWKSYNNPLEPLIKRFYSNFLKANNQEKGIESYSYVVALLVDYLNKH